MGNSAKVLSMSLVAMCCIFALPRASQAQEGKIDVDFSKVVGTIRPLNGVNDGPIVTRGAFDLSPSYSELGIKHIRLHDVPWTYENAVDINYVFPRFEASLWRDLSSTKSIRWMVTTTLTSSSRKKLAPRH